MELNLPDGNGLSELVDAARMAETLSEIYGADASMAAAYNGLSAWNDDRHVDKRLWANVLKILNS